MRRLPVYLLLDCSESMIGESLSQLETGVELLLKTLRANPHALETVWISCIGFDREARVLFPLKELSDVQPPRLEVGPGTALGAALELCASRIRNEVRKTTADRKGDWRPLVVVITDGQSTDDLALGLQHLGQQAKPRPANIYAIGCGEDVDFTGLHQISDIVLHMPEMSTEKFGKLFVWLTASITENSVGLHETTGEINLDKLPADALRKVDPARLAPRKGQSVQVMLFARCSRDRRGYLMRFRWKPESCFYAGAGAYPVAEPAAPSGSQRGGFELPPVNSSLLRNPPSCPCCQAKMIVHCGMCGGLFCASGKDAAVSCPHCGEHLDSLGGGPFDIRQSLA